MANKVYTFYKELPQWAKGVVVVGGIAIIYFTAKQTIARIRKQAEKKDAQTSVDDAKAELNELVKSGTRPTITKSQADAYAEKIVKQFKGADLFLGSFALVDNIFKSLKNNADFLLLKASFGVKTYDDAFIGKVKNVTLESAIQDELTQMRINDLNKTLAKQGITYRV
jgi:hypothetical protein